MKQGEIVAAFKIYERFQNNISLPNDISYAFFRLGKLIGPHVDFQIERQNQLRDKYHAQEDGKGGYVFSTEEEQKAFTEEINELINMDVDLGEFTKIPFKIDGRCNLSASELMVLDDFMEFE